jgi:hypothetical protein
MLSIIFGPRLAYTTLTAFSTLRAPIPCNPRRSGLAILKSFVEDKKMQVVGGIYQLGSGRVELLA